MFILSRRLVPAFTFIVYLLCFSYYFLYGQQVDFCRYVNVFLGTSGDHGQLSPAASFPYSLLSIGPSTNPNLHAGYEYQAKVFEGFTHDRMEGVGCRGSGGIILIKPFICSSEKCLLLKHQESAGPGYYEVDFTNGISAAMCVFQNTGIEEYAFSKGDGYLSIDFSHSFANGFLEENHSIKDNTITGFVRAGTTCREGAYKMYFSMQIEHAASFSQDGNHKIIVKISKGERAVVRVSFSSVNENYAMSNLPRDNFQKLKRASGKAWNNYLGKIKVTGDPDDQRLFYSLYYRTLQSPYNISEKDGAYRATDHQIRHDPGTVYNGWSIWDNYRTFFPLLSLTDPPVYQEVINSISLLYQHGKRNWATQFEPSNSVRTEHAILLLVDAYKKGFKVNLLTLKDSLEKEIDSLDLGTPDKALESCYDRWAMAEICRLMGDSVSASRYKKLAGEYRSYWLKDFSNLSKPDVDRLGARSMYQGTIWQYRWLVPYDLKGLVSLCGGTHEFNRQLDYFFEHDLYNAANETDLQAPFLYNVTDEPWKAQALIGRLLRDTVVQFYSDLNLRGIDPQFERIYKNKPEAFLRSMDDDAAAMSAWYLLSSIGLEPICVGFPVYFIHAPLFKEVALMDGRFKIIVKNVSGNNRYIKDIRLNGKLLNRNWITHEEIMKGGVLSMELSDKPNYSFGLTNRWITSLE